MTYSNVTIGVAETQGPRGGHHFVKNSESVTSVGSDSSSQHCMACSGWQRSDGAASLGPWAEISKEEEVDSSDGLM